MDSEAAFLYALWRDVVWDPTPSGGLLTSGDTAWLHKCPGEAQIRPSPAGIYGCLRWQGALTGDGL